MPSHTLQEQIRRRRQRASESSGSSAGMIELPKDMLPEARSGDEVELRVVGTVSAISENSISVKIGDIGVLGAAGATPEEIPAEQMLPPEIQAPQTQPVVQ